MIVQGLEKPAYESSMLKERLLNKFSPDDARPLGVQLSLDTTGNICQSGLKDDKHYDMVDIPLFTIDDDIPASGLGSQANAGGQQFSDNLILLSVDDILGSSGNPFLDSNISSTSPGTLPETGPRVCATEYQHQAAFFELPASRP